MTRTTDAEPRERWVVSHPSAPGTRLIGTAVGNHVLSLPGGTRADLTLDPADGWVWRKRSMRTLQPVAIGDTCPRTFEGAQCTHGYSRDEFGRVVDDHMHLGYDADGARVEWLSAWQAPSFRHPFFRATGVIFDVLALLVLGLGAVLFALGCVYGGGGGYYDLSTTERVTDGIAAGLLLFVGARMIVHLAYLGQQWGPDPFKGRQ